MLVLSLAILIIVIGSVLLFSVLEAVLVGAQRTSTSEAFDVVWGGLLLQGTLLLGASLIVPVNLWIWLVMMGCVGMVLAFSKRTRFRALESLIQINDKVGWKGTLLVLLAVGIYGSQAPCNYDTLLYHHQSTQWYAQYGSVQGVALLHYRLGFISSAFALAAPFESLYPHRSATLVNSTALFLVLLQMISTVRDVASGRTARKALFFAFGFLMVLLMHLFFLDPASAAPDFLVNAATVAIAGSIVKRNDERRGWDFASLVTAILLPLVKLSAAPVALLVCIDAGVRFREERRRVCSVIAVVGLLAIAALIGTSWRQTGNLVFPIPALQWDVAWGIDPRTTQDVSHEIRSWARWGGPIPEHKTESQWFSAWIGSSKGILFLAATVGNVVALLLMTLRSKGRLLSEKDLVIPCIGLLGSLYMLYSAPNPRFGFGMLILGWCWIGQWAASCLPNRFPIGTAIGERKDGVGSREAAAFLASLVLIGFCVWPIDPWRRALNAFARSPLFSDTDGRLNWFKPASVPAIGYDRTPTGGIAAAHAIDFRQDQVNDLLYTYPVNTDISGSHELPCAHQKLTDYIALAAPARGIAAGFIRKQVPGSEP
ncbi:MAG: LIC_10190 family membrane protein [Pirellula sp.]